MNLRAVARMFDPDVDDLLARVDAIADVLEATNAQSEERRTLAPDAVTALRQSGLFYMRVASETGGLESSPVAQMAVIAAVAKLNPSAAWSLMVGNSANAILSTALISDTVETVFGASNGIISAGVSHLAGRAERSEGGYYVSGKWRFASGLPHAEYVICNSPLDDDPSQAVTLVLRRDQVKLADNWDVFGLKGTGSGDFIVERAWVPDAYAALGAMTQVVEHPRRGGALFRMPAATKVTYEHAAVALGIGERALEILNKVVKTRVQSNGTRLADRDEVVYVLGKLAIRLDAAGIHAITIHHQIFQHVQRNEQVPSLLVAAATASVCHVTQVALQVAQECFRLTGTAALFEPSEIGRVLRDLSAANVHLRASDDSYYTLGRATMDPDVTTSYFLQPRASRS